MIVLVGSKVVTLWVIEGNIKSLEMLFPDDTIGWDIGLIVAELTINNETSKLAAPGKVICLYTAFRACY